MFTRAEFRAQWPRRNVPISLSPDRSASKHDRAAWGNMFTSTYYVNNTTLPGSAAVLHDDDDDDDAVAS